MKPERPLPRRARRLLVMAAAAALVAAAYWMSLGLPPVLGFLAFAGYIAAVARLDAAVGRPFRQTEDLDERQRAARDRAYRIGHLAMSAVLLAALAVALLLDGVPWPAAAERTAPLVIFGFLAFVHPVVPWAILAWTEPGAIVTAESPTTS